MYVVATYAILQQVFCQLLGHALGEGGDEHALLAFHAQLDLFHKVIHLVCERAYLNYRVKESCRAYYLFHYDALALVELIVGRGGGHINRLRCELLELLELERAVVECGRQAESELNKVFLTGAVTTVHRVNLRYAHVALVNDEEEILGEKVQQTVWSCSGLPTVEVA